MNEDVPAPAPLLSNWEAPFPGTEGLQKAGGLRCRPPRLAAALHPHGEDEGLGSKGLIPAGAVLCPHVRNQRQPHAARTARMCLSGIKTEIWFLPQPVT